ncbi:MAG: hypothetical protein CW338_01915 [Clostridiales bacterium]|nr:hypothetical protein [Clostridiales bacterium]
MRIIELDRDTYKGQRLLFSYDSFGVWKAVETENSGTAFGFRYEYERCPRIHREMEMGLFRDDLKDPRVFAVLEDQQLPALMEVSAEWNERLRISSLLVLEGYRRRGYGGLLMTKAKEIARKLHCRGLVLDVESCNSGAVAFFLEQGLRFTGCDLTCYTNQWTEEHETRLEMGMIL